MICAVPLLDMLRYQDFLVARFWVPEYGSSEDSAQFRTLLAYSPYHHVVPGTDYPAVLFVTGDSDTRVDPLHKAGHAGGKPVSKQVEDTAVQLQFLFWQLGMKPPASAGSSPIDSPLGHPQH